MLSYHNKFHMAFDWQKVKCYEHEKSTLFPFNLLRRVVSYLRNKVTIDMLQLQVAIINKFWSLKFDFCSVFELKIVHQIKS